MGQSIRRRAVLGGAVTALAAPLIIGRRASADDRSITVGIYTGQQGDVVRKEIIPPFEAKHGCKVYTTQGVTLEQIALMRSSRNNPKYSVMFIDDIGVDTYSDRRFYSYRRSVHRNEPDYGRHVDAIALEA